MLLRPRNCEVCIASYEYIPEGRIAFYTRILPRNPRSIVANDSSPVKITNFSTDDPNTGFQHEGFLGCRYSKVKSRIAHRKRRRQTQSGIVRSTPLSHKLSQTKRCHRVSAIARSAPFHAAGISKLLYSVQENRSLSES
jgi:hypothetical protein